MFITVNTTSISSFSLTNIFYMLRIIFKREMRNVSAHIT